MNQLPARIRSKRTLLTLFAIASLAVLATAASCRSTVPNRNPIGDRLPPVEGETLQGEVLQLPLDEPTVLLLGYVQDAQFDADRWLVGLLQVAPPIRVLEVPTIRGLFPRLLSNTIDEGMRSGIPSEDWQAVATVYGSGAGQLIEFTGNERPRNIRVLLVDERGVVQWFHDRGFSAGKVLELQEAALALAPREAR